ncbi:unnamed protein product [Ilex paraguariensis]|uniref:CMP/dCMP-type deaminase domain-containing protein n=1 Tax=Ilex paraguariensis TaxID=185542 RepID=A0ABC8S4N7_9AQUA
MPSCFQGRYCSEKKEHFGVVTKLLKLKFHCKVVNAAVIVDPATKQVIASACDQVLSSNTSVNETSAETGCFEHPEATPYCPIANGVDNHVSSLSNCSSDNLEQLSSDVSCLHPGRWVEQELRPSSCFWHPLRHAAIVAIENSAARDMCLFPASGHVEHKVIQAHSMQFSKTSPPLKRHRTRLTNVEDDKFLDFHGIGFHSESVRPYLCTGDDIYLVWEPCTMCAMALVHQRINRIFYAFPNSTAGALGSVHRLQGEKNLNHHYAVFRVLLPEEILDGGEGMCAATAENN